MTHPPRIVSSWESWLITIVLSLTGALAHATTCDVDADGDIDRNDFLAILADIGERASGPNDPRDADGNGRILSNDAQLCARRCTLPLCDIPTNIPTNKAPIAKNDAATTALDTPVRINVIANDRDRDGRIVPRTVRIVTKSEHGKVTNHRDGTVTYSPALGFRGRDSFRYRVNDNDGGATSNAARVRITVVESGNGLPMADAGPNFNVATGALVTLDGSNSSDPDRDPLTFSWQLLSAPPASTVTNASLANPATAAPSFTTDVDGPYKVALEVSDGQMTDVDTVRVTAATPNVPPNADAGPDQSAVIPQIVNLDGQASSDPDAAPSPIAFRWFFVAVPPGSALTDGNITGAATALASFAPDVAGAFRVGLEVDDGADTDQDEVVITVSAPNVPPNADAGSDIVVQLGPPAQTATLDGTASNDPDNRPSPLSFLWTFVSVPPGSVIIGADLLGATTATPSFTPDVAGQYLLRLDITDGDLTDTDQVLVTANVAPNAADDSFTSVENTILTEPAPGILANDTDGNSDLLTAALVTDVANGTLALNADGSFTYTPNTDFEGTDSFTYHANDGSVDSNTATVTITVTHANESPVAVDDAFTTGEDTPLVVTAILGVLGNDSDFESDPLTAVVDTAPANGTLTLNADGSFTYTPNPDFNGTDSFTYHANDGFSDSNVATVGITVDAVNDVPSFTVGPDQTVLEGAGAQTVNPWATGISPGPADEAGQAVSFSVSGNTNPALFSAGPSVSATGVLTYTPAADASGSATITLALADDGGTANGGVDTSAPQGFTITVDDINDEPSFTVGPDQTVNEGAGAQSVSPWATAIDDGDPGITQTLTFNVTGNTNASLFSAGPSVSPTGALTYTLAADANGTATITLALSDDGGIANGGDDTSDTQSFTITVNSVNDAPSFTVGPNQAVDEDSGAQSVSGWATGISPGAADESGQAVSISVTGNTNPGLFSAPPTVSPTGTLTYTPAANAFGSATITLTLSDDGGTANGGDDTSAPQSFTINVNTVNDAPSFTAGPSQTVLEDSGAQTANPWATGISEGPANESGQTLGFNITNNTNPGLFSAGPTVTAAGVLTFTPALNAFGSASIMLVIQDNGGTANGGVDTSGPQGFTITVTAVNDSPQVTPPAAYAAHAHIGISIPDSATDLFDGSTITDVDGAGAAPFTITAGTVASTNGGSATTAASGSFSYNPPVGFTGANDTFTYQVCDSGVPGSACTNATATVAVSGPRVWFVNNSLGSPGDGRLSSPFNTLAAADTAASANGDRIFVLTGASTYTGGFGLFTDQRLIGQGVVDTNFDTALGITPPATSVARPGINGTRPIINGTITLATGGTARGFNVNHTAATGVSGSGATGLTVNQVSVTTTTGVAVNLTNSGGTVSFTSVSANGAANGIVLNTTTGSFTVTGTGVVDSGGVIQNTTGSSILATNTQNLSLTRMRISNPGSANAFTFGIEANGLSGNANLLANTVIEGFNGTNGGGYQILNTNTNLGSLIVTGSTFRNSTAGNAFRIETGGTSNATLSVEGNSLFTNNFGDGVQAVTLTGSSGTVNVTVKNSTFSNANVNGNGGIFFAPFGGPVTFNFDVDGNTLDNIMRPVTNLGAINITDGDLDGSGPTVTGTIRNNTLNNIVSSRGIAVIADTFAGPFDLTIDNNNIDRLQSNSKHAINVGIRNDVTGAKVRVQNNDIGQAAALWTAAAGSAEAVLVLTQNNASANVLLSNNVIDANATLEVMRTRAINSSTLNATVTGNDLNDTNTTHIEFAAATGTGAVAGGTICLNASGNILPAAGVGVIQITENTTGTINVVQASAAAVATANSNATVTVTGTPAFGQPACTLP